jgi:hypothetical protein
MRPESPVQGTRGAVSEFCSRRRIRRADILPISSQAALCVGAAGPHRTAEPREGGNGLWFDNQDMVEAGWIDRGARGGTMITKVQQGKNAWLNKIEESGRGSS